MAFMQEWLCYHKCTFRCTHLKYRFPSFCEHKMQRLIMWDENKFHLGRWFSFFCDQRSVLSFQDVCKSLHLLEQGFPFLIVILSSIRHNNCPTNDWLPSQNQFANSPPCNITWSFSPINWLPTYLQLSSSINCLLVHTSYLALPLCILSHLQRSEC